jgi:hypothetical protein
LTDDFRNDQSCHGSVVPILTTPRVGSDRLLDIHITPCPDFVEDDPCALDQQASAFRQLDAARGSIQKRHTQGVLHVRDRFGYRWLGQCEAF